MSLPTTSLFDFACRLGYRSEPPKLSGDLSDWGSEYLLPHLSSLDGEPRFADVYGAWNEDWLAFAVCVTGKRRIQVDPRQFWAKDSVEIWLDTRDVRTAHRLSRYCHQFYFLPKGGGRGGAAPVGRQAASTPAPQADPDEIRVASTTARDGYIIEAIIGASALSGFDVGECNRLGFNYHINDTELGTQYWLWGKRFPLHADPSLWGTLELVK